MSTDFANDEMSYILKSSPLNSQQLIIPKFEINRLIKKFLGRKLNNQIKPEIIIINNNDFFSQKIKIDKDLFCHKMINKTYEIFYKKTEINKTCSI